MESFLQMSKGMLFHSFVLLAWKVRPPSISLLQYGHTKLYFPQRLVLVCRSEFLIRSFIKELGQALCIYPREYQGAPLGFSLQKHLIPETRASEIIKNFAWKAYIFLPSFVSTNYSLLNLAMNTVCLRKQSHLITDCLIEVCSFNYQLLSSDFRLPTSEFRLCTSHFRVPSFNFGL